MSEQDMRDVHAAGEQASAARQAHYHSNVMGQGAQAGDPCPAVSTQQSNPTAGQNPQDTVNTKSTL